MQTSYVRLVGWVGVLAIATGVLTGCPGTLDQIVIISDPALDKAIRSEIGKPFGLLTAADMLQLQSLDARNSGVQDLSGLEYAENLTWLDLDTNQISDLTPLATLVNLMVLNLDSNQIFDISPLAGLLNLDALSLFSNQVADIGPLVTNAVNGGLGPGDQVVLDSATLNDKGTQIDVPALQALGVNVVLAVPAK